jgi:hypothetical protein
MEIALKDYNRSDRYLGESAISESWLFSVLGQRESINFTFVVEFI